MADSVLPIFQFEGLTSFVNPTFWQVLARRKLEEWRLNEAAVGVVGEYSVGNVLGTKERFGGDGSDMGGEVALPCRFEVDGSSFDAGRPKSEDAIQVNGMLVNFNKLDDLKALDKNAALKELGFKIWTQIKATPLSSATSNEVDLRFLNSFLVLCFGDLKQYQFTYWFAFPAVAPKTPFRVAAFRSLSEEFGEDQLSLFTKQSAPASPFFAVTSAGEITPLTRSSLTSLPAFFGFVDPSQVIGVAGWPLRNFLAYLWYWMCQAGGGSVNVTRVRVIAYREIRGRVLSNVRSCVFDVDFAGVEMSDNSVEIVGYEKVNQKLTYKRIDLKSQLSPTYLSNAATKLNLELMKWRIAPYLDLEKIRSTKCLLLGAGTLGCHVARGLVSWGVEVITFVDVGRVNYSNPARQSLFEVEDCNGEGGGKFKAVAAAAALGRIAPGVTAQGVVLRIPMPGHESSSTMDQVKELEDLISKHDAVFLLLDSREARWLPTVIGAAKSKIVINAAIGFDSYVVQRHGMVFPRAPRPLSSNDPIMTHPNPREFLRPTLGCYFCTDITGPRNSVVDRTLDQSCTISRGGVAMVSSGVAVEVFVGVVCARESGWVAHLDERQNHGNVGKAEVEEEEKEEEGLGGVPHMVRGFFRRWNTLTLKSPRWEFCVGCGDRVISAYLESKLDFLGAALGPDGAEYLEEVSGAREACVVKDEDFEAVAEIDSDEDDDF